MKPILNKVRNHQPFSNSSDNEDEELLLREESDDYYDFKRKSVLKGVAGYIIVAEFCERLAYFGFAGSLVLFFQTHMEMSNAEADIQYAAWSGACYVTPLLGGFIADAYLGRFATVLLFCFIYIVGLIFITIGALPGDAKDFIIFPAMYIIALGTGGIKPNVCTLGADQFDDRKEKESFFNWFYWSVNLASVVAYSLVAYICQNGLPGLGGEKWGFFVGYSIPCLAMFIGVMIFMAGTSRYVIHPSNGSVFSTSTGILYEAYWERRNSTIFTSSVTLKQFSYSDTSGLSTLDKACGDYGGSYTKNEVEGVKLVSRLVPFLISLIPFWGLYAQINTAFQNQGCQMNLDLGGSEVPISALNIFEALSILVCVPVFDLYLFPMLKMQGYEVSMLWKIGAGYVSSMLCMILAAGIEFVRVQAAPTPGGYDDVSARKNITPCQDIDDYNPYNYQSWYAAIDDTDQPLYCSQTCDDTHFENGVEVLDMACINCDDIPQMSSVSIFWQIPQFMLLGLSISLAGITALEFFYTQAPLAMRSVTQSLNLFTFALGTWCTIPLLLLVNRNPGDEWVPVNLDDGHLSYYFLLLAGIMSINLVYYRHISKSYCYVSESDLRMLDAVTRDES